jgi:hypothetical protein
MISRLIILTSFVLITHFIFGQQRIDWAKYDCAAFKEDTTAGFGYTKYYKQSYYAPLPNIKASDALFELRVFPIVHHRDDLPIRILQFYEDSTILTGYYKEIDPEVESLMKKYRDSSNEAYAKVMTPFLETGGYSWRLVRRSIPVNEAKDMIAELSRMNLFTIDKDEEITSAENKIRTDPKYASILQDFKIGKQLIRHGAAFEIKYRNRYRVFTASHIAFYCYGEKIWEPLEVARIGSELVNYLVPEMRF